jgi:hypothetical protein
MRPEVFALEICMSARADVYLLATGDAEPPWDLVRYFDEARIRVVGDLPGLKPDAERIRRIVGGCAGIVGGGDAAACLAAEAGLPLCPLSVDGGADEAALTRFCAAVVTSSPRILPYAFMIGRLERDFTHAREAIRAAVEREAGIPCVWADDGRHRTPVESVRERTRLLLKHATFVIADLTLGVESPHRENPSRAHEIGMTLAYERKLMLVSQEPRRYPYFSIGDLQMAFWDTEAELEQKVREWIHANREWVARRVFNNELAALGHLPNVAPASFGYDPARRFIGPNLRIGTRWSPLVAWGACVAAVSVITLLIIALAG